MKRFILVLAVGALMLAMVAYATMSNTTAGAKRKGGECDPAEEV